MPAVDVDLWEAHYLIATSVPQTLRLLEQAVLRRDADKHGWAWLGYIATLSIGGNRLNRRDHPTTAAAVLGSHGVKGHSHADSTPTYSNEALP